METQKELLRKHRRNLDEEFRKKYPSGQFVIQSWKAHKGLYWNPNRRTSRSSPAGLGVESSDSDPIRLWIVRYQNNSWGSVKRFSSIDKFKKEAGKEHSRLLPFFLEFYETLWLNRLDPLDSHRRFHGSDCDCKWGSTCGWFYCEWCRRSVHQR